MKLSNIESRKLLPRFASKIAWLMDALDSIIKPISERVKSIDAPLTLEAIAALTDEELEALYDQYGVAQYYPELSRSTRDLMLYEMCKIYRCLGTPHAIELLCNYIFDNVPLNVYVLDNLAFDEQGTLIDASLLDVFDIEVNPELPVLSEDATARLIANIIRFSRNSQALRDIIYTFTEDYSLPVYPLRAGVPAISVENDAVCEPVTPPTPAYQEITLYMQGDRPKDVQRGVTSGFTGNVNTYGSFSYPLFKDAECTIPWDEYNYSNDYEIGYYADGAFVRFDRQSVLDLPDTIATTASESKVALILLDIGRLWLCSNYTVAYSQTVILSQVTLRIYPKGQQYYAFYLGTANVYGNTSVSNGNVGGLKGKPGISSAQTVPWDVQDATLPTRTIQMLLGSAGNELSQSGVGWRDPSLGYKLYQLANNSGASISLRAVVFTLSAPTHYCYSLNRSNETVSYTYNVDLYDANGNAMLFDDAGQYRVIGAFKANGDSSTNSWSTISYLHISKKANGMAELVIMNNQSVTLSKVWYIKTPIS